MISTFTIKKQDVKYPYNLLYSLYGPINTIKWLMVGPDDMMDGFYYVLNSISRGDPRIPDILRYYYQDHLTYREIGEKFNVTTERIRQIACKSCRRLKHPFSVCYFRYGLRRAPGEIRWINRKVDVEDNLYDVCCRIIKDCTKRGSGRYIVHPNLPITKYSWYVPGPVMIQLRSIGIYTCQDLVNADFAQIVNNPDIKLKSLKIIDRLYHDIMKSHKIRYDLTEVKVTARTDEEITDYWEKYDRKDK